MLPQADGGVGRHAPNTGRGLGVRGAAQSPASFSSSSRMDHRPFIGLRLIPGSWAQSRNHRALGRGQP